MRSPFRLFSLLSLLSLLLFLGAGCFGGEKKQDNSKDGGVFKSADIGAKWTQAVAFPTQKGVGSLASLDVLTLAIDPSDHEAVYMGSKENGLFYSLNGGASWVQPRDKNLQTGAVRSMAVDPKNVCVVYVATPAKLFKTETCTRTFETRYEGLDTNASLRRVAVDWFNPNVVYLGLSNGDLLKSMDGGEAWTKILSVKDPINDILVSHTDSRVVLVATSTGLFKTIDGGATFVKNDEALKKFRDGSTIYSLTQNTSGDTMMMATKYGLLRSYDVGETFEALALVTSPGQANIRALAMDPENPANIFYATTTTFYTSLDGGTTWQTAKLPGTRAANVLAVDPKAVNVLYLGVEKLEK